jgi:hypothetical protein
MPKKPVIDVEKENRDALDNWMKTNPGVLVPIKMAQNIIEEKTGHVVWFSEAENIISYLCNCTVGYHMVYDCLVFGQQTHHFGQQSDNIGTIFDLLFERLDRIEERFSDLERRLNNESK